ncbi:MULTISPECIES: FtsW/RodA/SpoVE family cell cycle protein [unclassified Pseudactinotalea]|uniref:FtsW/RodA/SpoVE family cell cycle protein n=1 Tax=unclassified Pseudactinotalea TaxID=2649176 RepID=UPI00128B8E0F|nr:MULTISPECIES: FtsW/RodA/SpoVE family cell cycle protein [unclassified Pseudactinotalea]MPV49186.1 FtsW/RodA/SpoVE family cell cycle protein [Pseudactinotalea sp. HY160]QGH68143.1 FtsW/RodA/SpoVE family cell cycle protein [Pseudactinotalea sp. HY158]
MATVAAARPGAGRGSELVLLAVAVAIGVGGLALVGLGVEGEIPGDLPVYAAVLAGVSVALHLVLRWRAPHADPVMVPIVVALTGLGLAMIYRLDLAAVARGRAGGAADRQLLWTLVGAAAAIAVIVLLTDHRLLRRLPYLAGGAGLLLLLSPLLPVIGQRINGAQLWVNVAGVQFQPAEPAKILLAIFFAAYLVTHRDSLTLAGPKVLGMQLPRIADFGPLLIVWAASIVVLVVQRDLGTSLLFFGLFVAMLYVSTERVSWILIGLGLFAVGVILAVNTFGHVAARFDIWLHALDPDVYFAPYGSGQLVDGLFGLAAGGLLGTGWGQGHPYLVPYANSDFIIASLGEELGLTGLMAILLMYLILIQRGLRASIGVRDGFGKLLGSGFAFVIAFQCFIIVGGVTRLIPLTGLTTPFLAAGGSSLVSNWIIVAILLRISDAARSPAPEAGPLGNETVAIAIDALRTDDAARPGRERPVTPGTPVTPVAPGDEYPTQELRR